MINHLQFSFTMHTNNNYQSYLQALLKENNISFVSLAEFEASSESSKLANLERVHENPPFKTNLHPRLSGDLCQRYSRQMLMKEVAYDGQLKIMNTKVAIVGSGGIGCPVSMYLAAAGIGTIGLFDQDQVELTNLHRQVGHRTSTIGVSKTESLKRTLLDINPNVQINQHPFVTVETASLLDDYDLVIDGSDNPICRYIVNDYLMSKGRKLLSGACVGWQAQITCYGGQSPCYRCVWGSDQRSMGNCATLGVIGTIPGLVGLVVTTEAIKMCLGQDSAVEGKLLTYSGRTCDFRKMKLRPKKEDCPACGPNKLDMHTYDYSRYAGCSYDNLPVVPNITWKQMAQKQQDGKQLILDVRPSSQYNIVHLDSSFNVPYDDLIAMNQEQLNKIKQKSQGEEVFVSCRAGVMSRLAAQFLLKNQIKAVNVEGGIRSYGKQFDPSVPAL